MARNRDIETIRRANINIKIPDYISLTPAESDYWDRIVRSRHADDWTESDLELVGDLCRARALEKRVRDELDQGALMLAGKPHPLIAEAARCSGVTLKLVTALRLKTPAETRTLRGKAGERTDYGNPNDLDELIPRLRQGVDNYDPSIPRLPIRMS
ncbi:hypothetical protein PQR53_07800 [Paraburkholderia fungorum]|uniref:hypothetical protein n=1 Tax=Paraburkholderia fungorum TaxID=134537 RepID=UPI0038B7844B